jgi:NhaP-type Na+/H+ or K+/H+ antiporter
VGGHVLDAVEPVLVDPGVLHVRADLRVDAVLRLEQLLVDASAQRARANVQHLAGELVALDLPLHLDCEALQHDAQFLLQAILRARQPREQRFGLHVDREGAHAISILR